MGRARKIAKILMKGFNKLAANGELAKDGEKVAKAILDLREERKLTSRELNRRVTI